MKRIISILFALALVLAFSLVATTPAAAATPIYVNASTGSDAYDGQAAAWDGIHGPKATIGAGIAVVDAAGTVNVAAGTYGITSMIAIDKSLTIIGDPVNKPVVQATGHFDSDYHPGTPYYMLRGVYGVTATINIQNLVLDGNGYDIYGGMRFNPTHSGTIEKCVFQHIKEPTGSQYLGIGIVSDGTMTIDSNVFTDIGRVGIWVGTSSNTISYNVYTGKAAGDWIDYGIEVGMGGIATITGNTITGCTGVASSDGSTSAGILVTTYYGSGTTATITGNTLTGNTYGIAIGYDAADTSVVTARFNDIYGNNDGVDTTSTTVTTDATTNWWGAADGPSGQGPGTGDTVSTMVTFTRWLGAKVTDQPAGCTADVDTGATACPSTDHVSAAATGGAGDTSVYVAEYVGNPTSVGTGFGIGGQFFDVRVDGTVPTALVIDVTTTRTDLVWFDGTSWLPVSPTTRIGGILRATLSNTSSPTIAQLLGQPFGSGNSGVGWETYPISKVHVLLPWIALLAAALAGASLLMVRRRRTQS